MNFVEESFVDFNPLEEDGVLSIKENLKGVIRPDGQVEKVELLGSVALTVKNPKILRPFL